MLTSVAVKEENGKVLLSALQWEVESDYETITILADSMRDRGQLIPVTIDCFGNVVNGAKRCEAALRSGWFKIICMVE